MRCALKVEGQQLQYNNETLQTAQSQIQSYNLIEKPLIINPEQETEASLKTHFTFDLKTAEIVAISPQMKTTIEVCQLNRKELVELREDELVKLKNHLRQDLFTWKTQKEDLTKALSSTFVKFKSEIHSEISFVAWQNFIIQNWKNLL